MPTTVRSRLKRVVAALRRSGPAAVTLLILAALAGTTLAGALVL